MAGNNRKVIPECREVLKQWKYEIAVEFGLPVGGGAMSGSMDTEFAGELGATGGANAGYGGSWGHLTSRENGSVGGEITKRLVAKAQQDFLLH